MGIFKSTTLVVAIIITSSYAVEHATPTLQPSLSPSILPSELLSTIEPSSYPSNRPSEKQIRSLSDSPSLQPSKQPSFAPSKSPSIEPSIAESDSPSRKPSMQPSKEPSFTHSKSPSEEPSNSPSVQPSKQPSSSPSKSPSIEPSANPSRSPSGSPSLRPSKKPSYLPSVRATTQPSFSPSAQPSSIPSSSPSTSPTEFKIATTFILPLGDSITQGSGIPGGYRKHLYDFLTDDGYKIEFVGTKIQNCFSPCDDTKINLHDGHGGKTIQYIDENINGWMQTYEHDPDIILLLIGTNDFGQKLPNLKNAINKWDSLIDKIVRLKPHAHVIASNLLERKDRKTNNKIKKWFNPFVQDVVNKHAGKGHKVSFVNLRSDVPLKYMPDGLHPNSKGYELMAMAFRTAIKKVVAPNGDNHRPQIARIFVARGLKKMTIIFSKPMLDKSVNNIKNFEINKSASISAVKLDETKKRVILDVDNLKRGEKYKLYISGLHDRTENKLKSVRNMHLFSTCLDSTETCSVNEIQISDKCSQRQFKLNCPVTCGTCTFRSTLSCEDFQSVQISEKIGFKQCESLERDDMNHFCIDTRIREKCPVTCGACQFRSTIATTCKDSIKRVKISEQIGFKKCKSLKFKRFDFACKFGYIKEACPVSCNACT